MNEAIWTIILENYVVNIEFPSSLIILTLFLFIVYDLHSVFYDKVWLLFLCFKYRILYKFVRRPCAVAVWFSPFQFE